MENENISKWISETTPNNSDGRSNEAIQPVTNHASNPPSQRTAGSSMQGFYAESQFPSPAEGAQPQLPQPVLSREQQIIAQVQAQCAQLYNQNINHLLHLNAQLQNQNALLQNQNAQLQNQNAYLQNQCMQLQANNTQYCSTLLQITPPVQFCAGISFPDIYNAKISVNREDKLAGFPCLVGEAIRAKGNHVQYSEETKWDDHPRVVGYLVDKKSGREEETRMMWRCIEGMDGQYSFQHMGLCVQVNRTSQEPTLKCCTSQKPLLRSQLF
eukprot:scaffold21231_cov78-Skeletonema_dohrnii-CCMP3373.AAC.1